MSGILADVRGWLAALCFRQFFFLIVIVAAAAQWACVAWIPYAMSGRTFPFAAHFLGVGGFYACNRVLIALSSGGRKRFNAFLRVYTAGAFISLMCSVSLVVSGALWLVLHGLGALSAEALSGPQALLPGGINDVFRWFASTGMAATGLVMLYGYVFGQRQLRVTELTFPLRGWSRPAAALRIAQISDIHVGPNLSLPQLDEFVARVNALTPDLICVTGDIADSGRIDCATFFPVLGRLRARFGVYAVLGNHDHYAGADRVAAELRRWTDFRVLRDEGVTLDLDGARLHVIGLDDRGRDWARGAVSCARLSQLIEEAPGGVPILLLSHRPDIFVQAADHGIALTLSGHTHGGQLALPWFNGRRRNFAEFITPFDRGLYQRGDSRLYVNCGLGVTGQRIRLWTPREITVFEIEAA